MDDYVKYYFLGKSRIVKTVKSFCPLCYHPVTIDNYLSPANTDDYALRKTATATTTTTTTTTRAKNFLITNRVVSNPYSHSTTFDPRSFVALS